VRGVLGLWCLVPIGDNSVINNDFKLCVCVCECVSVCVCLNMVAFVCLWAYLRGQLV
jgi:hypothetical protein